MNVLRDRAKYFWNSYNSALVSEYIHEHCPEEAAEVIRQAELLLNNTFVFTDRWDMEPCAVPYQLSLDNWVTSPNGDPEWVFMLNRHDFLHKLWQAWLLTGERCFVDKLLWFMLDWIDKNPITLQGTDATRTIDTGIRCMNWSVLLIQLLASDMVTDVQAERILNSLAEQCRNMRSRYIGKYALSNWGVLQTTAVCTAYLWFPEYIPEDVALWAWEELRLQLSLQILPDGSHWEQSPMYHVEVLNTCARLLAQLQHGLRIGCKLKDSALAAVRSDTHWNDEAEASAGPGVGVDADGSGWLTEAVRVLSRHVLYTCDPGRYQLPLGDSDVTDVRDVLARAAVLLDGGGIYRWAAGEWMDLDSAFLLGAEGIAKYHKTLGREPDIKTWNCADSGNICFRTDWTDRAGFTALKCGTLGSSHGHGDQTHMSLYHKGQPFLVDSGRYTYLEEETLRMELKRPRAHNVCVIDGYSGGEPNGSWSYHRFDETLKNYYRCKDNAHYAEMSFHGALPDGAVYLVNRKVLAVDDGIWLSCQNVVCEGSHEVREYFHLHGDVTVNVQDGCALLQNRDAGLRVYAPKLQLTTGVLSDRYNEKHDAPLLIRQEQMCHRMTSFTMFADADYEVNAVPVYQMRREEPVSPDVAAAWDVVKPDGKKYTLILWNRETCRGDKLYSCHGVSVYGKAVILDWEKDGCRTIRLRV